MRSAIVFKPGTSFKTIVRDWNLFLFACGSLANKLKNPVRLMIQHSPQHDEMAMMLELPNETIAYHHHNPSKVVRRMSMRVLDHISRTKNVQVQQAEKRPSGKKGSSRHRRKSSARKRRS